MRSVWETLAAWLGELISALFRMLPEVRGSRYLIIALGVALAALVVARLVLHARAQREFWAGERGDAGGRRTADPWREAERLAGAGAHLEATHYVCAAALLALARRGEVTLHPSKTTGDYARELQRRGAPSAPDFRRFRARFDRIVYDAQACAPGEYADLVADARPLLTAERAASARAA